MEWTRQETGLQLNFILKKRRSEKIGDFSTFKTEFFFPKGNSKIYVIRGEPRSFAKKREVRFCFINKFLMIWGCSGDKTTKLNYKTVKTHTNELLNKQICFKLFEITKFEYLVWFARCIFNPTSWLYVYCFLTPKHIFFQTEIRDKNNKKCMDDENTSIEFELL